MKMTIPVWAGNIIIRVIAGIALEEKLIWREVVDQEVGGDRRPTLQRMPDPMELTLVFHIRAVAVVAGAVAEILPMRPPVRTLAKMGKTEEVHHLMVVEILVIHMGILTKMPAVGQDVHQSLMIHTYLITKDPRLIMQHRLLTINQVLTTTKRLTITTKRIMEVEDQTEEGGAIAWVILRTRTLTITTGIPWRPQLQPPQQQPRETQ